MAGVGGASSDPTPTPVEVRGRGPSGWVALGLFAAALVALVGLSLVGQSGGRPGSQAAVATPTARSTAMPTATPTATSSPTAPPTPLPGTPPPRVAVAVGPVPTCPPGSTPDKPGPVAQARPNAVSQIGFDRRAGKLVALAGGDADPDVVETWTFDVCTNTWTQMHPDREPPPIIGQLVYDVDSDVTVASDSVRMWAYDLEASTWTEKGRVVLVDAGLSFYDPASGLVVALGDDGNPSTRGLGLWSYEVESDTWTPIPIYQALASGRPYEYVAYDASVDRLVAYASRSGIGHTTWLFDLRTGTWSGTGTVTPEFSYLGWGMLPAIAYDEAAERTVLLGQGHSSAYDAAADRWETLYETPNPDQPGACSTRPECRYAHRMVYDPVNERLIVYGGVIETANGQIDPDDVLAFDTRTGEWTVLLDESQPITQGSPSPSPATYDLGLSVALIPVAADFSDPTDCTGTGEWADLHSGVDVIVTGAAGAIIGTAPLSKGVALGDPRYCRFEIRVGGLPELPSYTVRIGRHEYPGLINFADIGHSTLVVP